MKEVTVKELVTAFEGQLVKVETPEHYGLIIDMDKARIEYDEECNELSFTAGNYNHDGIASIAVNVEDDIASIEMDDEESDPVFVISFNENMLSDIVITRFKTIEELENERKRRKRKNFDVVQ